jgi:DnaJ-class molecular chaperone
VYDQYGEEGFKHDGGIHPCTSATVDSYSLFQHFFDGSNPLSDMMANFFEASGLTASPCPPDLHIEYTIELGLEDLYRGYKMSIVVPRYIEKEGSNGKRKTVTSKQNFDVNIERGWKEGTKVRFSQQGSQRIGHIPSDVIFHIKERPHKDFVRKGDDLEYKHRANIWKEKEADQYELEVSTIDKGCVTRRGVSIPDFSKPTTLKDLGMPLTDNPEKRGNLIVTRYNLKKRFTERFRGFFTLSPENKSEETKMQTLDRRGGPETPV